MKYKKVCKEVNKIKSFAIGENKVLIGTPHEVIDFETNNVIMRSDVLFQELYSNNLMFWINDLYGKGYLLKKYYEVISLDEYIYTIKDQYIITSKKIGEERFTLIKNIKNELESYKLYGSSTIYFVSSEKFFRKNFENNFIECFSFPEGEFLWQFDLTQLGKWKYDYEEKEERKKEVKQFVGAYNNILWIYLNSKEFIALDIQSGELKYDITGVEKSNLIGDVDSYIDNENNFIFYDTEYILDGKKGKIIGLIADRFFEVDLRSENIEPKLFGLWDKMKRAGVNKDDVNSKNVLYGNSLYFYLQNQLKLCILDINTKEILYVSEVIDATISEYNTKQIKDMQIDNENVYLLDSGGTLHVFEKEKDI